MPAVIKPDPRGGESRDKIFTPSPLTLLRRVSPPDACHPILRSSFSFQHDPASASHPLSIVPNKNGFAHTVIRAWQQDLHLRLRPDDVWLAILTQFSFFVNANADALRSIFVSHNDRPELLVSAGRESIETIDLGDITQQLTAAMEKHLRDPNIVSTLLPSFTTTTPHDRATAAMAFLGTMQEYFSYGIDFGCSFPSVTLLGERGDWADMLRRVAWFSTIGHEETDAWTVRLTKVVEYMVASFDRPDETDVKRFWNRAVHETESNRSGGIVTLSGWLTAFCWWGADGKRVRTYSDEELSGLDGYRRLTLDGVEFPVMERKKVPVGFVKVPLSLEQEDIDLVKAALVAGSIGMQVLGVGDGETAAQPASGWWLLATSEMMRWPTAGSAQNAMYSSGLMNKRPSPGQQDERGASKQLRQENNN